MDTDPRARRSVLARTTVLLAAACFLLPAAAAGQSVTDRVQSLAQENARLYIQPVASSLGAGLSSGFFGAASSGGGVSVRVGAHAAGGLIPETGETFEPVLPEELTYRDRTFTDPYAIQGDRTSTPTAAGEGEGVILEPTGDFRQALLQAGENPEDFEVPFPDGFDVPGAPLGSARATVGLPTGTSVTGSLLPKIELSEEVGSVSSFGVGVRQSLSAFAADPPVDVAVAAEYQALELGSIVEATGKSASLIVSRDLELITVFTSGALEESTIDVEYTFENPEGNPGQPSDGTTIAFEEEGANTSSFTGGIQLDLFLARLTVSYTKSEYDVLRAGLSFGN